MVVPERTLKEVGIKFPSAMSGVGSTSWTSDFTTQHPAQVLPQSSLSAFPVIDDITVLGQRGHNLDSWSNFDIDNTSSNSSQTSMNQLWAASEATSGFINTTLNLQILIETLALNAVCIGPGPGNRSGDITNALRMAIVCF